MISFGVLELNKQNHIFGTVSDSGCSFGGRSQEGVLVNNKQW